MDLSIIVLTFNAKDVTLKMLRSLKSSLDFLDVHSSVEWEVIVVDNGSTDGVAGEIENEFSSWLSLTRQENVGFAKGNNVGVAISDSTSSYLLFLNPDIILEKDTVLKMYDYAIDHEEVGISTCLVGLWSGGIDIDSHRGFPTPWRALCYFIGLEKLFAKLLANFFVKVLPSRVGYFLAQPLRKIFGGYHLLYQDLSVEHDIDVCLGAFMMIPRVVGEKVSWWPEDYFTNGEDVDLCYQVKELQGYKITYVPTTKIIHYKGASKGTKEISQSISQASQETKERQISSGIDAMKTFYDKYYVQKYPKVVNAIVYLGINLMRKKRILLGKE